MENTSAIAKTQEKATVDANGGTNCPPTPLFQGPHAATETIMPGDEINDPMLAQVRECFGKVAWSHKTHECEASYYHVCHNRLVWAKIIVSAFATGAGILSLMPVTATNWITAVLVTLGLIIELVFKNRAFAEKSALHQAIATKLWRIRESYQSLIATIMSGNFDRDAVRQTIEVLADELEKVYEVAPRTSDRAYKEAGAKIHSGDCSCSEEEVDKLLPPKLRIGHD